MSKTKVAVIGAGHIGRHHVRNLAALPDVELVAVVDADETSARQVASRFGAVPLCDPADIEGKVDAVSIAVPTTEHRRVADRFLRRGVATLVEKPLAFSVEDARAMVEQARRHQAILQVGHIERYNPAWNAFESWGGSPTVIEAQRLSQYPYRSIDVSVVFDVMIHDLDLVLAAIDSPVDDVAATGDRTLSPTLDRASVHLRFRNGAWAVLCASRVHYEAVRHMRLLGSDGSLDIDFLRRTSVVHRIADDADRLREAAIVSSADERAELSKKLFEETPVAHDRDTEPLRSELSDFIRCAREGATPTVSGEHGLGAVELASRIERCIATATEPASLRKSA